MNSGKYLYKMASEKKNQISKKVNVSKLNKIIYNTFIILQKPQLKYITNETINHFKKFISKLNKKEEDALLKKKKKREEIKQKNRSEKQRQNNNMNNRTVTGNGMNQYNCYPPYIPQLQQIPNQNPPGIMNDYPYYYQYYPMYGIQQIAPHYFMEIQKNLPETIQDIYQRGIVNNIIGAFFIQEYQEKLKNKKTKIPISLVNLADEGANNNFNNNENCSHCEDNKDMKEGSDKKGDNNNEMKEENENNNKEKNNLEEEGEKENEKEDKNINHQNELKKPDMAFQYFSKENIIKG